MYNDLPADRLSLAKATVVKNSASFKAGSLNAELLIACYHDLRSYL